MLICSQLSMVRSQTNRLYVSSVSAVSHLSYERIITGLSQGHTVTVRWQALDALLSLLQQEEGAKGSSIQDSLSLNVDNVLIWHVEQSLNTPDPTLLPVLLACLSHLYQSKTYQGPSPPAVSTLLQCWKMYRYDAHILEPMLACWRAWAKNKPGGNLWISREFLERLGLALTMEIIDGALRPTLWGLLKDLTFRASPNDKMTFFKEYGVVVVKTIRQDETIDSVVLDHAISSLWNWAVAPEVARSLVAMPLLWQVLEGLHREIIPLAIRTKATATLGTLISNCATETDNTERFEEQTWIVSGLIHLLTNEKDVDWRRRAFRTLRCLVSADWGRRLTHDWGKPLYDVIIEALKDNEESSEARTHAGLVFANLLKDPPPCWDENAKVLLETTFTQLLLDPISPQEIIPGCATALSSCLEHCPRERDMSSFSPDFYERLGTVLQGHMDDPSFHLAISSLVEQIMNQFTTQLDQLLCKPLLDLVTLCLTPVGPAFDASRSKSLQLVEKAFSEKKTLAEHQELLAAIVNVCLITSGETKAKAKQLVLQLVPEI